MKKVTLFTNRWLITGTLTTLTELHIGDGGAGEIHDRSLQAKKDVPGKEDESDASTVCVDAHECAYLPASAIKGALRSRVKAAGKWDGFWAELLGSDKPDAKDSVGGKLVFFDARWESGTNQTTLTREQRHLDTDRNHPWWDNNRKTCVAVSVSLDRRTRTAKDQLLYHLEYVPAQETFRFEIGADNLDLKNDEIKAVLGLLESFNASDDPVTLGGQTSNGWGSMKWTCESAHCFDNLNVWLQRDDPPTGFDACTTLGANRLSSLAAATLPAPADHLVIKLKLILESPWLIRDPRQRERSQEAQNNDVPEDEKPTDAIPIQDESGKPFVPAKSLRGVLRSRAEMILRTLGKKCADHPEDLPAISTKGSHPDTAVEEALAKVRQSDLAACLFGLSGWQAPLHVPRLSLPSVSVTPKDHHQEFVAIDRFDAANTAKFDADLAGLTTLEGTLTIDLDRLKKVDAKLASLGLLALVLRDLGEGDMPIGSGSAKGQGFCTADATVTETGMTHTSLTEWFQKSDLLKQALPALRDSDSRNAPAPKASNH